ncbi:dienelactone hydrolase [Agrobacterium rhizogenes]|nr:dienelactone hydrolase [Rhizobium rhizogenes]NTH38156.1 dienelactone hydrolase [Rhizobium rhizogenes]NTJ00586.1 dienelactone hydrolase [Rhizobium rhizogenes]
MPAFLRILLAVVAAMVASPAFAVGFQYLSIPDDTGRPIEIGIWYPSKSTPASITVGMVTQNAALNGEVDGSGLPMVIFAHGSAGWFGDRSDTALLFAQQGIVAVSLTYPGDNHKDSSDRAIRQLTNRPVVTTQVIDYVLDTWSGREHLDKSAVGFYGFSAGGFTGLVELGGVPNWTLFSQHCAADPTEPVCKQGGAQFLSSSKAAAMPSSIWHHDSRIKAAVLASPGFGFAFDPVSLRDITTPVELWGGSNDQFVPFASNVTYLKDHMPDVVQTHEVENAKHYSFLRPCSPDVKAKNPEICSDLPGFDRAAFQETLNRELVRFFQSELIKNVP